MTTYLGNSIYSRKWKVLWWWHIWWSDTPRYSNCYGLIRRES